MNLRQVIEKAFFSKYLMMLLVLSFSIEEIRHKLNEFIENRKYLLTFYVVVSELWL